MFSYLLLENILPKLRVKSICFVRSANGILRYVDGHYQRQPTADLLTDDIASLARRSNCDRKNVDQHLAY